MPKQAAKQGDHVIAIDTHVLLVPGPGGVATPMPMPFDGTLDCELSADVLIEQRRAAVKGSTATGAPHVPTGGVFQRPPSNRATVHAGSASVYINGKPAARADDAAVTCNDPDDAPVGRVVATSTVHVGG